MDVFFRLGREIVWEGDGDLRVGFARYGDNDSGGGGRGVDWGQGGDGRVGLWDFGAGRWMMVYLYVEVGEWDRGKGHASPQAAI